MLNTFFSNFNILNYLLEFLFTLPVLFIAFPVHECAHGLVAYMLGDDTAKRQGRLTLNPLRHLDVMGTIFLLIAHFGWAKPVPVNPNNFKNRKAGMALVALAGPFSNLIMAFISLVFLKIVALPSLAIHFLLLNAEINVGLFIFNLIPIPPLDGSRIMALILPGRTEEFYYRYASMLQIVLILMIMWGIFSGPLATVQINVMNNIANILHLGFNFTKG